MSMKGIDPGLQRGHVPGGHPIVPPHQQGRPPQRNAPVQQPIQPPAKESKGIICDFFDTIAWIISGIHDLIFSCFVEEKDETEEDQVRGGMIPIVLDRWFPKYPKLGQHLEAQDLIEDLQALPDPLFRAIDYAFFEGRPSNATVEAFVNDFVMKVDPAREIKDDRVIESLNRLSPEEFADVRAAFFEEDPGPLSVEAFVKGHVMKQRFGSRLHAGHLSEDLMGLPRDILKEVYTSFFQGMPQGEVPNLDELSVGAFVNGHIVMKRGAKARLEAALRLQAH